MSITSNTKQLYCKGERVDRLFNREIKHNCVSHALLIVLSHQFNSRNKIDKSPP